MKIYIVSSQSTLEHNSGFVRLIANSYEEAFDYAESGQFIHAVDAVNIWRVVNGGKISQRWVDGDPE